MATQPKAEFRCVPFRLRMTLDVINQASLPISIFSASLSKRTPRTFCHMLLQEGRSIGIRLAAEKQVGKIYQGEIYLRKVKRSYR
eukprot:258596-Amphidinium_carterae.1